MTTSQTTITQNGWTGSGYIIIDPTTGSGAYMIGGADGAKIAFLNGLALGAAFGATLFVFSLGAIFVGTLLLTALLAVGLWIQTSEFYSTDAEKACLFGGGGLGMLIPSAIVLGWAIPVLIRMLALRQETLTVPVREVLGGVISHFINDVVGIYLGIYVPSTEAVSCF